MFKNFVSLGSSCYVAASMSRYGLRSWSGPFDWLLTPSLNWVLHYEDDFKYFLLKENLVNWQKRPEAFCDTKSGFIFLHDGKFSSILLDEYDNLRAKYGRRIERFLGETKRPTCFLRLCDNQDEVQYILNHYKYIISVIKKNNEYNEIIFLIYDDIVLQEPMPFQHFRVPRRSVGICGPTREQLRDIFVNSIDFLECCASNYDAVSIMKNIIFDQKNESPFLRDRRRYHITIKLLETDFSDIFMPKRVIIYGAGNTGRILSKKIKSICEIKCFIDEKKFGEEIEGIPVCKINEINYEDDISFIVTATYDYENILEIIKGYYPFAEVIRLDDMLSI